MTPDEVCKDWYRDDYLLSSRRNLVQADALNAALDSDLMWWAKPLPQDALQKIIDHSLCFGLYKVTDATSNTAGEPAPEMVGFARIVTDYATVGYLTDVYILKEHQGRGLGAWMMHCVNEALEEWPHLRRVLLLTSSPEANRLYEKTLGASEWDEATAGGLSFLQKIGGAAQKKPS